MSLGNTPSQVGPTEKEAALVEVGAKQWGEFLVKSNKIEPELIKQTRASTARRSAAEGLVSADTAASFSGLAGETTSVEALRGATSGSSAAKFAEVANTLGQGTTGAAGQVVAERGVADAEAAADVKLAAFGRGVANAATIDLARGARRASALARAEGISKFEEKATQRAAVASLAGGAVRKFGPALLDRSATGAEIAAPTLNSDGVVTDNPGNITGFGMFGSTF